MKLKLLILSLLLNSLIANATNYYIGAGGNNNNSGTTINLRWLDVTKVNNSTFAAGDSILFAGGQTFAGGLKVPSNGVIIASYNGGRAILSGFETLSGWSSVATNIWQCTPSPDLKATCNILTVDGTPYAVGRTPNINYFTYQSANTTTLTSATLVAPYDNMTGAEAVIRKNNYSAEKVSIINQCSNVLVYQANKAIDNNTPTLQQGTAGYGFFLQRFAASLDIFGEWFYNDTTNTMRFYSASNPVAYTIKASYIDTIIYTGTHTGITFSNLEIEGGGLYGIYMLNGSNITIKNCVFNNNTRPIYSKNGLNININNDTLNNNFEAGIVVANVGKQISILNNIVTNSGQLIGMGLFWSNFDLGGIAAITDSSAGSNFINVIGNTVRNIGHMGIDARGSNLTIRRNIIDSFANQVDDAGGFYTWVARTTVNTLNYRNRILDSNFISNGIGAYLGTNGTVVRVKGAYIDDQSLNWIIRHNTIWNVPGNAFSMNNPKNVSVTDNTVYNCNVSASLVHKINGAVTGNTIKRNILYQKLNAGQENWFHQNDNLTSTGYAPNATGIIQSGKDMAVVDTNWISNQLTNGYRVWYSTNGSGMTFPAAFPLTVASPSWRVSYLHDLVSILPPITITNTNTTLWTNPSSNLLVVNFPGFRKIDPKGVIYDNQATIPRWSSLILIDDGNSPTGTTPPTVNAGVDKSIVLPTNSVAVTATSTNGSGSSGTYTWSQLSGPNTATNSSPSTATTTFGSLIAGIYQMKVRYVNNLGDSAIDFMQITVNAAPIPPTVNAGVDKTITLPTNSVSVTATSTNGSGTSGTYTWSQLSGPNTATNSSPNTATTIFGSLIAGTYQMKVKYVNNLGDSAVDFMQITVNPAIPPVNLPPIAVAGPNQNITLPTTVVTVDASGSSDPEGGPLTFVWTKISGPATGTITNPTNVSTTITALSIAGVYIFQVAVTDVLLATTTNSLSITVNAAPQPPTVNAGVDQSFMLPINSTSLTAVASDPEGGSITYSWVKLSGPAGGTIGSPTAATTAITGLLAGSYIYSVTVTDNQALTASDAVQITVIPAPIIPPTVNAGVDKSMTLPTNSVSVTATSTNGSGTSGTYTWSQLSGPNTATNSSPNTATTIFGGLTTGIYQMKVRYVNNLGDSAIDFMQITVNAAPLPPVSDPGPDQVVQLPINSTTVSGNASTDPEGGPLGYLWQKVSGPTGGNISNPTLAITTILNFVAGIYRYSLTVTGNTGLTNTAIIQITINQVVPPVNLPPVADAGPDQTITLPTSSVTLDASGSIDPEGLALTFRWQKISGPVGGGGTIASPTNVTTLVTGLTTPGVYFFQVVVKDPSLDSSIDVVRVTVNSAPQPPTVNAGVDQSFTLPINSTSLTAVASDPQGSSITYAWTKLSGPAGGTIGSPTSATTAITSMVAGVYIYNITVTNGFSLTSSDAVQITVNPAPPLIPPVADAGIGQTIVTPATSTTLSGSATDQDGTITGYGWLQVSGPNTSVLTPNNTASIVVSNLIVGTYQYELTATDNDGLTGKDTVQIDVVDPPNTPPIASAGGNISTSLTTITLNGSGSDQGGSIVSYQWVTISRPAGSLEVIVSPTSATTQVNNLIVGTYVFRLTVTDNGSLTASDEATVEITPISTDTWLLRFYKTLP